MAKEAEEKAHAIKAHEKKLSSKQMIKIVESDVKADFKLSLDLQKQFKKNQLAVNDFVKQFVKARSSHYEG